MQESLLAGCLDPADRAVLRFARGHRRVDEPGVQACLGLSAVRYYQRLHVLLNRVEALYSGRACVMTLTGISTVSGA